MSNTAIENLVGSLESLCDAYEVIARRGADRGDEYKMGQLSIVAAVRDILRETA
ncbi:hypothetical protein [Rhodococcus sp. 1168]|uniref:hypothetical protein n=1 Tax=Rhodococcus sp. 1168 TaxID=2018041 RepID=UPI001592D508|nr:hypothetical protein [Rhodococcus sp. 1168]